MGKELEQEISLNHRRNLRFASLPEGMSAFIRDKKSEARKSGEPWEELVFPHLTLQHLLILYKEAGPMPQRGLKLLEQFDMNDIKIMRGFREIVEDIDREKIDHSKNRLIDAVHRSLYQRETELRREKN